MMPEVLTPKRERFCQEYLIDLNATHSAIRSGYSAQSAKHIGYENLQREDVLERLRILAAERSERVKIDQDWVLEHLRGLVEFSAGSYIKLNEHGQPYVSLTSMSATDLKHVESVKVEYVDGIGEEARQVKSIAVKGVSIAAKVKALEVLAKHLRMFDEVPDEKKGLQLHLYLPDNGRLIKPPQVVDSVVE